MCNHAAAILTRTDVHWCETDSHTDEIKRLGLRDDGARSPDFVRIEINPPDNDFRRPLAEWRYHADQDIVPDWYEPRSAEAAVRGALPAWVAAHVVLPEQRRDEIASGLVVAIYGNVGKISGNAHVGLICDSAHVDWIGNSVHVGLICGNAHVDWIGNSARVARIGDSAHVDWIGGNARVGKISDNARVDWITDNARVGKIGGSAGVHAYSDAGCSAKLLERGHIVDMRGDVPRIIVAS